MVSEAHFAGLVEAVYEAGADDRQWERTLALIAQAYHARTVVLGDYSARPEDCRVLAPDIDQSVHERYATYYHAINPIWRRTIDMAPEEVRTDTMIVPRPEFVATEFFHDFLRPQDIGSMLGVAAHNQDGRLCVVSVQRERPFDADDVALYRRLAPHVRRAVQLNLKLEQLETRSALTADALDGLRQGVLIVDGVSRLLFANRAAEKLFVDNDGLRLVGGVLQARATCETDRLHKLVACCCGQPPAILAGGSLVVSRGAVRPKVTLTITPLRGRSATFGLTPGPAALILAEDPEQRPTPAPDGLMRRFGLTPKETSLAMEMLGGGTVRACADRLGISRATAQTHLAHIFQKTGARRQAELVRLLMQAQ